MSGRFLSDVCGPNNTKTAARIADEPKTMKGNDGNAEAYEVDIK